MTVQTYDEIGVGYALARRADPVIFEQVMDLLGDTQDVVNIGAGTGNYEPTDRSVVAVEPYSVMRSQRQSPAPVVAAFAENLPFADKSFETGLAMFTIHHWPDRDQGITELGRVSNNQVVLVYEPLVAAAAFWLSDYFTDLRPEPPYPHPTADWLAHHLTVEEVRTMYVPANCTDGFAGCYWNRPDRYLDEQVQAGMSVLAKLSDEARAAGSKRLASELASGQWDDKYGHLRDLDRYDAGYRLARCRSH